MGGETIHTAMEEVLMKSRPTCFWVSLLLMHAWIVACGTKEATVWQITSSPSGNLQAALLVEYGSATVAEVSYVAVYSGNAPNVGDIVPLSTLCYVWRGYRAGIWKITWETENQVALAVHGPLPKEYENTIRLGQCEGVSARWYREERPLQ